METNQLGIAIEDSTPNTDGTHTVLIKLMPGLKVDRGSLVYRQPEDVQQLQETIALERELSHRRFLRIEELGGRQP